MASIYDLKPKFQNLLRPLCKRAARAGITANQVTLIAFGLSFAHGAANIATHGARWVLFTLPVILFLRMALNAIDGMLAREHGQETRLGALLNELTDVLSDAALYLPFAFLAGLQPGLIVLIVFFGAVAEMAGIIGIQIGSVRRYDGPFGKSDRAFFFGALSLVLAFEVEPGQWSTVLLAFAMALSFATIVHRGRNALRDVRTQESSHA
ncbi:CDP-alcohol phosphatidyltransferase family protein [Hyphococcus lacteus]|uniref:CDP-alcohol phosphatidyltransferase family protein n=1 Tax=Hyphococcus lacteus TaxID=3143536 RepID=A0ABV3Z0N3_9PROT